MSNKVKYILFLVTAIALIVIATVYLNSIEKIKKPSIETTTQQNPNETNLTETTINESGETETEPESVTDEIDEIVLWQKLDDLSEILQDFYAKNRELTRLITKDGRLYNKASERELTLEMFKDRYEIITDDLVVPNTVVCLIKPSDLAEYDDDIRGLSDSEELTVFAVTHDSVNDTYYICSKEDGSGVLKSSDYLDIMGKYSQDHGAAGRRFSTDKKYKEILNAINDKESYKGECFVRYLAADEKYACAVISPPNDFNTIKQYVLEINSSGKYDIKISDLEREPRVFVAVNNQIPDLNLELIPYYTIANDIDFMFYNFGEITIGIQNQGKFDKSQLTNIKFASATDKFMYIMYDSGLQFFGIKEDDVWNISDIEDVTDAEYAMLADSKFAPLFILLQNS